MKRNLKVGVIAFIVVSSVGFSAPSFAKDVSAIDCAALSQTLDVLLKQNLAVVEFKESVAKSNLEAVVENTRAADDRQKTIERLVRPLDAAAVDAKDLMPGIRAFRKLCP